MITEAALIFILEQMFGVALGQVVNRALESSRGQSDAQRITNVLKELERQGYAVGNLQQRVRAIEVELTSLRAASIQPSQRSELPRHAQYSSDKYCTHCGIGAGSGGGRCSVSNRGHFWTSN